MTTHTDMTDVPAVAVPWHAGLLDASLSVLIPCGFLYYGLHAMAVGWGAGHTLVGLAGYLAGWTIVLVRLAR